MKYFTIEWWNAGCEDEAVIEQYRDYYDLISSKLPDKLLTIDQEFTLHDANVTGIETDLKTQSVQLFLSGFDITLSYEMEYVLHFKNVISFQQLYSKEDEDICLGDLGYWEYEILDSGVEMRMLFAIGTEFSIIFQNFDFEYNKVA